MASDERVEQVLRGSGDLLDCLLENGFVGLRRFRIARDLPNVLERGGSDFDVGRLLFA